MARPRKPRGRHAPQLQPVRVSTEEFDWFVAEVARLQALGHEVNAVKFMRDRIFRDMPGYVPHLESLDVKG